MPPPPLLPRRIAALCLGLALAAPLASQRPSRESELASLRAEIARLERRLSGLARERSGLAGELARAEVELALHEKKLAEAVAARDLVARQAAASERSVAGLEAALAGTRQQLARRLAGLYRLGSQGYLRLLLSARPGVRSSRFLPSIRLMRYLARRDRVAIDRYLASRERLGRERELLLARRGELERWLGQEAVRRRRLAAFRERQAALLARAEGEERALSARVGALAAKERRLAALLDALYGGNPQALAGQPIQQFRGVLDWPAAGRVTSPFGPRLDPRYRTRVPHNGVDLGTPPGGEVRAVFPGKVLFAAPLQGYGTTLVVHHPGRVFTLYAGLSELKVGREDMVHLGDVVGLASDRLYFEIRVENRPEDPLTWLR